MSSLPSSSTRWEVAFTVLTGALVLAYAVVLVRTAWLCDDAYITFRVADNFVHGYGPVWNVAERVQTFTHPLWMLLLSAVYFFTREIYLTSMFVSMVLSLAAVVIGAFWVARSAASASVAVAALLFAKPFVDYSTSGLENPLTYLFLALFAAVYFGEGEPGRRVLPCALIASLAMTNRIDTILFFAPSLALVLWQARSIKAVALMAAGFAPFVAWTVFATFYYGFPLPNTAYAKLNTGVPAWAAFQEGFGHLISSLNWTPFGVALMFLGFFLPIAVRDWRAAPLSLGALLYALYFMRVGGDFMVGRFFSGPVLIGALLLSRVPMKARHVLPALVTIAVAGLSGPYPTVTSDASYGAKRLHSSEKLPFRDKRSVSDHRGTFYQETGLLRAPLIGWRPVHVWALTGERLHGREGVRVHGAVGFVSYNAGPGMHIIDYFALGDPLLAHLPLERHQYWRSGHYSRKLPSGYRESIATGENRLTDPDLAAYYDKLTLITRGPLFSPARLWEIWQMNRGVYAPLIEAYSHRRPGGSMADE